MQLPKTIAPMLATLASAPFDSDHHLMEVKWDGTRAIAFIQAKRVRFQRRRLTDISFQFPELLEIGKQVRKDNAVFDREIICLDEKGRSSFERNPRRKQT